MTGDLKSLGATEESLAEALNQVAQIASKGTVELEDLKSVATAGVSLTRMYEGMAEASGKTVADIRKLQAAGKLTADIALPGIQKAILASVGQTKAGAAAEQFAGGTLRGGVGRAQAALENWVLSIGDRITPMLDKAAQTIGRIIEAMSGNGSFEALADSVVGVFERLSAGLAANEGMIQQWLTTGVQMLTAGIQQVGALFTWISENSAGIALGFRMLGVALSPVLAAIDLIVSALSSFYEALTWVANKFGITPSVGVSSSGATAAATAGGDTTTNVGGINVTVNAQTGASPGQIGQSTADAVAKIQARFAAATAGAY